MNREQHSPSVAMIELELEKDEDEDRKEGKINKDDTFCRGVKTASLRVHNCFVFMLSRHTEEIKEDFVATLWEFFQQGSKQRD